MQTSPPSFHNLYQELQKLDSHEDFSLSFRTPHLLSLFHSLTRTAASSPDYRRLLLRLQRDIRECHYKSVYVVLKWLVFLHQLFQVIREEAILERMVDALNAMSSPKTTNKFEEYFERKLLQPYGQYLRKLAIVLESKLQGPSPSKKKQLLGNDQQLYCQYNLMVYAQGEFASPIRQFTTYLKRHYPCLTMYSALIGKDLSGFHRKISMAYEQKTIAFITFIEVERLGSNLTLFIPKENQNINWQFDSDVVSQPFTDSSDQTSPQHPSAEESSPSLEKTSIDEQNTLMGLGSTLLHA